MKTVARSSLADIKTLYANKLLLERFISTFGIDPNTIDQRADAATIYNQVLQAMTNTKLLIQEARALKLDIKDYSRKLMEAEGVWAGFRCKIGDPDSSVGWADVMAEIRKLGFCGWGSAEVSGGDKERLADISKRMDDVFNR